MKTVAGLMALSARIAPKAVGLDSIKIDILTGKAQEKLANQMIKQGGKRVENGLFFVSMGSR